MRKRNRFCSVILGVGVALLFFAGCAKTTTVKLEEIESDAAPSAETEEASVPGDTTLPAAIPDTARETPESTENIQPETTIPDNEEPEKKDEGNTAFGEEEASATAEAETEPSETAPSETEPKSRAYILNKNSKKIHYPSCSAVKKMSKKNREEYEGTMKELKEMGYEPCGKCRPR